MHRPFARLPTQIRTPVLSYPKSGHTQDRVTHRDSKHTSSLRCI
ncbi:hypothetical protein HMPREF9069_01432 [Atopobium sp. oral taxon 810 str. F0209]|nr:hypothetical protein HMPREF9069_01432 [Atopobium sp. oral taxon 810 str. F0209]